MIYLTTSISNVKSGSINEIDENIYSTPEKPSNIDSEGA